MSKIGRVAQFVDSKKGYLYSEFDTSIFSLTTIPIVGWWKLLPTFGGCVITAAKARVEDGSRIKMEVDYTTSKPVEGLQGLGKWIWSIKVRGCLAVLLYGLHEAHAIRVVLRCWATATRPLSTGSSGCGVEALAMEQRTTSVVRSHCQVPTHSR